MVFLVWYILPDYRLFNIVFTGYLQSHMLQYHAFIILIINLKKKKSIIG